MNRTKSCKGCKNLKGPFFLCDRDPILPPKNGRSSKFRLGKAVGLDNIRTQMVGVVTVGWGLSKGVRSGVTKWCNARGQTTVQHPPPSASLYKERVHTHTPKK